MRKEPDCEPILFAATASKHSNGCLLCERPKTGCTDCFTSPMKGCVTTFSMGFRALLSVPLPVAFQRPGFGLTASQMNTDPTCPRPVGRELDGRSSARVLAKRLPSHYRISNSARALVRSGEKSLAEPSHCKSSTKFPIIHQHRLQAQKVLMCMLSKRLGHHKIGIAAEMSPASGRPSQLPRAFQKQA